MSINALRNDLRDVPGIEHLSMTLLAGRQNYNLGGKVIALDASASDSEVKQAIRAAVGSPALAQMPAGVPVVPVLQTTASAGEAAQVSPASTASQLPKVNLAPPVAQQTAKGTSMSVTGAAHVGSSLKDMLNQRKQKISAAHDKLNNSFGKLDQATAALDSLGDDVSNEADDLLATIGQFKNDLG